jgi:tRNA(Ile)-lysidine synthase
VLAHILRGTGLTGLGGIHPVAGSVIRPLLQIRRKELQTYLRAKKQKWREDATNRDTIRMRARIRRKLLPVLEKRFQPAIVEHLTTLADFAREDESFLETVVEKRAAELVQKCGESVRIAATDLLEPLNKVEEASALSKRLVRHIVKGLKPRHCPTGAGHVDAVLELARHGQSGTSLPCPVASKCAGNEISWLFMRRRKSGGAQAKRRIRTTSIWPRRAGLRVAELSVYSASWSLTGLPKRAKLVRKDGLGP